MSRRRGIQISFVGLAIVVAGRVLRETDLSYDLGVDQLIEVGWAALVGWAVLLVGLYFVAISFDSSN